MLGTLMKYELKSVGRIMLPIYGAFMIISVLFGVSLFTGEGSGADSFLSDMATTVTGIVYTLAAVAVFVVTIILLLQRFYINLLGNEGYLCFTLPVDTNAHIANKVISAVIWIICGMIVACISATILLSFFVTPNEIFAGVKSVLDEIQLYMTNGEIALCIVELIVLVIVTCGLTAVKIYAGISAGQIWSNHRIIGAVAAYIVFGICESILINAAVHIGDGWFSMAVNNADNRGALILILVLIAVQCVFIAIYWVVTYLMLDRKLNLQ